MQLFYAPDITLPVYTLPEDESKHAVRVLHMASGDVVNLTDGRGNIYIARITDANPKRCVVEISGVEAGVSKRDYTLTMAVAPTKNANRYGWFLEKATEVGVDRIVPIDCHHSERHSISVQRENNVITSAMKQSVKACRPILEDMQPFARAVAAQWGGRRLIAHCHEAVNVKRHISEIVGPGQDAVIFIGPEGDFSPEEVAQAVAAGFEEITLGDARLRTETAALTAVMHMAFINQ